MLETGTGRSDPPEVLATYLQAIETAHSTFTANRRVCAQSIRLRGQVNVVMLTYRAHRFPRISGASDTTAEAHVRRLLRDFVSRIEPATSFARFSRGSMCQACGNVIKHGEIDYDVVAGTSVMRLDADCYKVFVDETRAVAPDDTPDAA